jgi:DNA-binding transcriptional ArsR family regulator
MGQKKKRQGDDRPGLGKDQEQTNQLLSALKHPLRRQILQTVGTENAISTQEISQAIGQPLSKVSYHVHVLAECDAIALVTTKPARDSTQRFYSLSSAPESR